MLIRLQGHVDITLTYITYITWSGSIACPILSTERSIIRYNVFDAFKRSWGCLINGRNEIHY